MSHSRLYTEFTTIPFRPHSVPIILSAVGTGVPGDLVQ
jgi:hypothetical protein